MIMFFSRLRFLLVLLSSIIIPGCASDKSAVDCIQAQGVYAYICPQEKVRLPAPAALGEYQRKTLMNVSYQERSFSLVTITKADGRIIRVVAYTPMGIKLLSAAYDGDSIKTEGSFKGAMPDTSQMLLDIMLSSLGQKELRKMLPEGFTLEGDALKRRILKGTLSVYEIGYERSGSTNLPVLIKNNIFNYKIALKNL